MKVNEPDVSIIVTVHNSEEFLAECLTSVCSQTYQNIEIICVDGGSKDRSPDILKQFAKRDNRIRIINDDNTSYGHKLNVGFQTAKGRYVGILESDDKLCNDMVANLYGIARKYEPDIVGGNIRRILSYRGKLVGYSVQTYKRENYYNHLITKNQESTMYAHGAIFASLYRRDFLLENTIKVNETPGAAFQDQGFSFLTEVLFHMAYYINIPVYEYRIDNAGSSVHDNKKVFEIIWEMNFIEQELRSRKIVDVGIWNEFWKIKYLSYIGKMKSFLPKGNDEFKNEFELELKADMQYGILNENIFDAGQILILKGFLDDRDFFEKNFVFHDKTEAEKICAILDKILNESIVIFGAGQNGQNFYRILTSVCDDLKNHHTNIECFCDNSISLEGKTVMGKMVLPVKKAAECFPDAFFVVTNTKYYNEMTEQLGRYHIGEERICLYG